MHPISCLLVEDEVHSQDLLSTIIEEYCPQLRLIGIADSVKTAFSFLQENQVDLIFLDIELEDGNAFELLDLLPEQNFFIVFTTAYDSYAMQAFKVEAVDYLLKPYSPKDVILAVNKVVNRQEKLSVTSLKKMLLERQENGISRISLSTSEGISLVAPNDIIYCTADGAYCTIHLKDKSHIMVSKTLGDIEGILHTEDFIRVHASHLVNIHCVKKYLRDDGGILLMENGKQIPISRRKKQEFLDRLKISG
ncbi:MAG TPA: LytTR family DNA-binding domain-containing protein [Saprospiraceae bacterium]|nr:LytTR family DNA-binding domain-containing protein [Saprospiraceae bacterium]